MNSNGLDIGLANGRFDNSFVGLVNGRVGSEQMISEANTFIFTIKTTSTRTLNLPLVVGGTYNFWVDWGDGKKDYIITYNQANSTHTYPTALKVYTVKITGICRGWSYNGLTTEQPKLLTIERWGCLELIDDLVNGGQFASCVNLDLSNVKDTLSTKYLTSLSSFFSSDLVNKIDLINNWDISNITNANGVFVNSNFNDVISNWNTSNITTIANMFQGGTSFNQYIGNWDTGNVTNMFNVFASATVFNQEIGYWNTSKVTTMSQMFASASAFNNGLASGVTGTLAWNTSACTNMSSMFNNALAFNQDINGWDVSKVTNMATMFSNARAFNNGLASGVTGTLNWNTSACTSMSLMFYYASAFNQDINGWDVSKVTTMSQMFQGANAFNQNIDSWDVSKVTTMSNMFNGANAFNQPLSGWNTSACTNMQAIFINASAFNNGLASGVTGTLAWNTINATISMGSMFNNALAFNQNINSWNTENITLMNDIFNGATSFNQPLSGWNTSKVTNMSSMFLSATAFDQNIGNWNVSACTIFTNFMGSKTPATFSATNLDAIYNGWINNLLKVSLSISFGSAKRTAASTEGRALLTRANTSLTVTGAVNNGSGLIRITTSTVHGMTTGNKVFISAVTGAIQANGLWTVTEISTTQVDLQGSAFSSAYISGGAFRTGYGWTIVDGGI